MNNRTLFPEDRELTFPQIIASLQRGLPSIVLGAFLGLFSVLAYRQFLAPYTAEIVLNNACADLPLAQDAPLKEKEDKEKEKICALDFSRWRILSETLPALASEWAAAVEKPGNPPGFQETLARTSWWDQHIIPVYGLSQAETKKFPLISDTLKAKATQISTLKVTTSDHQKEIAAQTLDTTVRFIKDGATYFDLKTLLEGYQSEILVTGSRIDSEKIQIQIEAGYLQERVAHLRSLLANGASNGGNDQVRIDLGTANNQFLPLRTQINAAEITLADRDEARHHLEDQAAENEVLSQFLSGALPIMGTRYEGVSATRLIERLLAQVEAVGAPLPDTDRSRKLTIERIRGDLHQISGRYSVQLSELSRRITPPALSLSLLMAAIMAGSVLGYLGSLLRDALRLEDESLPTGPPFR